jgi:hypothetical protein
MGRTSTRQAVQAYLEAGSQAGPTAAVPFLSTVYAHPPKLVNESDFYSAEIPGTGTGGIIFIYIGNTDRRRIGPAARNTDTGEYVGVGKWVEYDYALMCYLRTTKLEAEDAGEDNDAFLDGLIAWIEADRNLGTAPGQGPSGVVPSTPGAIFQAGEGSETWTPDLRVHSLLPKANRMGTLTVFTSVAMKVIEIART